MQRRLFWAVLTALLLLAFASSASTITRSTKTTGGIGGEDWVDGKPISAAEMNAEFILVFNVINGQLDTDNLKSAGADIKGSQILDGTIVNVDIGAAAAIAGTKIDELTINDFSATDLTQEDSSSPGTSDATVRATTLEIEIEQLRYKIEELTVGTSVGDVAGAAASTAYGSWVDGPIRPGNLIYHGGFDAINTLATGSDGDGWVRVLTPTTLAGIALTESEGQGSGNALQIIDTADNLSGVKQTIDGLKASTRYLAVASVKDVIGTCNLSTTGSGSATQLTVTSDDTSTWQVLSGVFVTDATPANVVLQLLAVAANDECYFDHVGVYEINTDPAPRPSTVVATSTVTLTSAVSDTLAAVTGLSATVTPPLPNCVVRADAFITMGDDITTNAARARCQIFENSSGKMQVSDIQDSDDHELVFPLYHINANPTPGTALAYTVQCKDNEYSDTDDVIYDCTDYVCSVNVTMSCGF